MTPGLFVIDTNVLVAGLVTTAPDSPALRVLDAMLAGRLLYLMSPALLQEYRSVLSRPNIARLHGLAEGEVDQVLVELTSNAIWRDPRTQIPAPDSGDDHLWALLASYPGSVLVTGDRLVQDAPPGDGLVISPRDWLENYAGRSGH